jgi:hypothetical protein
VRNSIETQGSMPQPAAQTACINAPLPEAATSLRSVPLSLSPACIPTSLALHAHLLAQPGTLSPPPKLSPSPVVLLALLVDGLAHVQQAGRRHPAGGKAALRQSLAGERLSGGARERCLCMLGRGGRPGVASRAAAAPVPLRLRLRLHQQKIRKWGSARRAARCTS